MALIPETERLNVLFSLLSEMTQSKISDPKFAPPLKMQRWEKLSRWGFLLTAFVFLVLVALQIFGIMRLELYVFLVAYVILVVFAVASVTIRAVIDWHQREQHFPAMLTALKNDLHHDDKFIKRLWEFDKATLHYGLLQYRYRWLSFESRVVLIAGDLRKIGLYPAVAAILIATGKLLEGDGNSLFWATPVTVVAILYLLSVGAHISLERPQQVIQLLEYAIQHADKSAPHLTHRS